MHSIAILSIYDDIMYLICKQAHRLIRSQPEVSGNSGHRQNCQAREVRDWIGIIGYIEGIEGKDAVELNAEY